MAPPQRQLLLRALSLAALAAGSARAAPFSAKNKLSKDQKYTNTSGIFEGSAPELIPVHSADAPAPSAAVADDVEIPF